MECLCVITIYIWCVCIYIHTQNIHAYYFTENTIYLKFKGSYLLAISFTKIILYNEAQNFNFLKNLSTSFKEHQVLI